MPRPARIFCQSDRGPPDEESWGRGSSVYHSAGFHTVIPAKAGIQLFRTVNGASLPSAGLLLEPVSLHAHEFSMVLCLDSGFRRRDETNTAHLPNDPSSPSG